MQSFNLPTKNKLTILALGAESAGNFSVYIKGKIYFSEDFGDLLEPANWRKFKSELNKFLGKNKIKPEIIITDLHPLYKTTALGRELSKKYKAKRIQIQHHLAHIFSAISKEKINSSIIGIALDGTGYGSDGNIWGGEIFKISKNTIKRIGHLENQTMIGGDLTVKEPARMLIGILDKVTRNKSQEANKAQIANHKNKIYRHVKKYYSRNQFELLYNQLQSGFNCQETSSTGRVLDAVSILLGFCQNERNFKHEPALLLEQNSTIPYRDLKPVIKKSIALPLWKRGLGGFEKPSITYQLDTTYLFKYILKYIHKDKHRLAATAQLYIAQGLHEIIKTHNSPAYLSGGISNNKIISQYLISKGAIVNPNIPRGDAGISFGQIFYYLANSRH